MRLRLCDLGTGVGLRTEDGFACEALASEGAAFVSVGDYQVFLLPTGRLAPLPWSAPAVHAWAAHSRARLLRSAHDQPGRALPHLRAAGADVR